jgi:hypothetical protein
VPKCTYPNTFAKDLLLLELFSIPLKYSCNLCDERCSTDYYWRPRPFIKTVRLREKHPAIGLVRDFEIKLTPPPRLVCGGGERGSGKKDRGFVLVMWHAEIRPGGRGKQM